MSFQRKRKELEMETSSSFGSFSGGEIRMNEEDAKRTLRGTEVWNRDPLPKPKPPVYKLFVANGKYEATATANSFEALIAFELQMRDLGYEFIKLERLQEGE